MYSQIITTSITTQSISHIVQNPLKPCVGNSPSSCVLASEPGVLTVILTAFVTDSLFCLRLQDTVVFLVYSYAYCLFIMYSHKDKVITSSFILKSWYLLFHVFLTVSSAWSSSCTTFITSLGLCLLRLPGEVSLLDN